MAQAKAAAPSPEVEQPQQHSWPADKVERWPIGKLTPYARNPRTHSATQVKLIVSSIKEWGWTIPILVDEEGTIIAGHGRVMAAEQLGLTEVPVMIAKGWTEAQKRAYVIADNQIPMSAGWDDHLLKLELGELSKINYDLKLTGFDDVRLALFGVGGNTGQTDPDEEEEPQEVAVSGVGDVWIMGKHRIICGDCTEPKVVAVVLGTDRPHLMVTDPPYGVDYDPEWRNRVIRANGTRVAARAVGEVLNDDRSDWTEAWKLFAGDVAYVWHGGMHAGTVQASLEEAGLEIRSQIIWAKQHAAIGRSDYHWKHEPCWYAVRKGKNGHYNGDRKQTTVWDIDKPQKSETGHSTQKPVECMKRPMENNSKPGEFVYEPFAGSGTSIIAAEMCGRICLAIELKPSYVDMAVRRWQKFTGGKAILQGTKRNFETIEKERAKTE